MNLIKKGKTTHSSVLILNDFPFTYRSCIFKEESLSLGSYRPVWPKRNSLLREIRKTCDRSKSGNKSYDKVRFKISANRHKSLLI